MWLYLQPRDCKLSFAAPFLLILFLILHTFPIPKALFLLYFLERQLTMITSIYLLYQILAVSRTSQAISTAPIEPLLSAAGGNRTALRSQISPPWVSNSGVRGTSDILWSCIVTLTACVYTAIHLNVPPPQEGRWQFLWRKAKWVALALFAPEIVLYCALAQLLKAREFKKEMNELWATQQASLDYPERKESNFLPPDALDSYNDDNASVVE